MGGLKRGRPPVRKLRFLGWSSKSVSHQCWPFIVVVVLAATCSPPRVTAAPFAAIAGRSQRLVGIVSALAEVLGFDVADVQEAIAPHAEIDEGRLDARLQVDDDSFIDVADVAVLTRALDVQLFQGPIFHDRDPAFLRLGDIDQHFLFHGLAFCGIVRVLDSCQCRGKTDERAFERQNVGGKTSPSRIALHFGTGWERFLRDRGSPGPARQIRCAHWRYGRGRSLTASPKWLSMQVP